MKEIIINFLTKKLEGKLQRGEIESLIETPSNPSLGDFAFPCFKLVSSFKKNPIEIAKQLEGELGINIKGSIEKVVASGAYLNFFINKKTFVEQVVKEILKKKDKFGAGNSKDKVLIEFSQANTHKAFHVGHIRGTSLGESISRILEFQGNKVIRANYQGDTGMHVAKWIWNYTKNHPKDKIIADESWIAEIYVDAVKRLDENEKLQEEVDIINKKLEDKSDKNLNELWRKTRKICLDALEIIYKELNTHFDRYYFESEVELKGKEIAKDLVKRGIAEVSEGATIMNLEQYNLSVWVLLRKDGTVLYSSKDLALIEKKFKENKIDRCIYLVANEQDLHFQQLFKTLELMNFKGVKKCKHVDYGMVRLPEGKMSSRTGKNILYSDFKKEVVTYAKQEIKKRYKLSEKELEERALKISIAAIKYAMLKQTSNKNIVFSKEDAISFEGDTGPYIQYSYARASSILKKSKKKPKVIFTKDIKIEEKETLLIKKLAEFPEVVQDSYKQLAPSTITNYALEISHLFNEFYHTTKVIDSQNEEFLLALVGAFRIVLKKALYLLGIDVIEEM